MKTVALRYAENFAPECGTIAAHNQVILDYGSVWYGKLGNPISEVVAQNILSNEDPRILLIHSGSSDRFWAHIDCIQRATPELSLIPEYYQMQANDFGCWFRVKKFEAAQKNVMSQCMVVSSGKSLSLASRHSMSPYFIIDYKVG